MHLNRIPLCLLFIVNSTLLVFGQDHLLTYELKKGEAFDILLLTTIPNSKEAFTTYREKAFPVALEMGYSFLPGFNITKTTVGELKPKGMILGKWKSLAHREQFMEEIEIKVPNLHELRKDIWSLFRVTYFEIPNDYSFQLDTNKILVATAFWKKGKENEPLDGFIKDWKDALKRCNGSLKIELINGKSPKGYYYKPDYVVLTQWNSNKDLEAFHQESLRLGIDTLLNRNEFVLGK